MLVLKTARTGRYTGLLPRGHAGAQLALRPLQGRRQVLCIPGQFENNHLTEMCSGTEAGSYLRLIDSCITQVKAQGPSRTCNESKEEERVRNWLFGHCKDVAKSFAFQVTIPPRFLRCHITLIRPLGGVRGFRWEKFRP